MRKLVLDDIEDFRCMEQGFNGSTMRWSKLYLSTKQGLVYIHTKKDKGKYNDLVKLDGTTREDFGKLSDEVLLTAYTMLIRQMSKQM